MLRISSIVSTSISIGLILFASAFLAVTSATAKTTDGYGGIYSITIADIDVAVFPPIVTDAMHTVRASDLPLVAFRSIGRLKPVYEEALATDALNFIDLRRRC